MIDWRPIASLPNDIPESHILVWDTRGAPRAVVFCICSPGHRAYASDPRRIPEVTHWAKINPPEAA